MNTIFNCCKIAPVDTYPGVITGIHPKIFDCIGAGILPIVEYRRDTVSLFSEAEIPIIENYNEMHKIFDYYLNNEDKKDPEDK